MISFSSRQTYRYVYRYLERAGRKWKLSETCISEGNMSVNKYHKKSSSLVKASTQARVYDNIKERLTDEETAVYKRGRNAKSATAAKNASIVEYRMATGIEALIGYLYLSGRMARAVELIKIGLDVGENE